jgi:hypothetical protein
MEPINYSIDVQTPFQAALQGYQAGAAIRNDQLQQQQQQLALQQQQQQAQVIRALISNPNATAQDYANAMQLVPSMKDTFKQAFDMKNAEQQQNDLSHVSQVFAALQGGQPEVAATLLDQRAEALRNAGNAADAKNAETMAGVVRAHPDFAKSLIGMKLSAIPGGDKVITGAAGLGAEQRAQDLHPAAVVKAGAEATTAQVAAGNAPTKTALDNEKAQQDIKTAEAQRRIADLDIQIKQADSETKRGELIRERDKQQAELTKLQQAQGQSAQDTLDALTQGLQTVKAIKAHPGISSSYGLGGVGTVTGKISGLIPGTDRKDLEGLVDTLKSQQFLAGVKQMTGLGQLSNAEGEKIGAAVASLNMDQSPKAFMNALGVIEANLNKAQAKAVARGQAPTSGTSTPVIMTHPTFGQVRDADVNRLMLKYPGQTREQVLQFLRDTGGK